MHRAGGEGSGDRALGEERGYCLVHILAHRLTATTAYTHTRGHFHPSENTVTLTYAKNREKKKALALKFPPILVHMSVVCVYICIFVCVCVCTYVCMYVCMYYV